LPEVAALKVRGLFSQVHKTGEMVHPLQTKVFLKPSSNIAMLFAPLGCTHPPSLSAHTKLIPKDSRK